MGIVANQSIKNTVYSFIGVALGAVYTLFIVPQVFEQNPEEWGLIQLINSYILLFMPFALLGFPNVIIKYWPRFQENKERQSFLSFLVVLICLGLIILSIIIILLRKEIFFSKSENSVLTGKYYYYFFPLFFIHTFFYFFIYFTRVYYKTSFPTLIKDTFIKVWTFILIVSYFYFNFSFDLFFKLYFAAFIIQLFLMIVYSRRAISFRFRFKFDFFSNKSLKEVLGYGFFSILTGITSVVISRIDLFMINKYLSLQEVAFYSVALFFITVMQIPSRSIGTIVMPILSDFINKQENSKIRSVYNKTSINLFLAESFILMIILLNLNEFMSLLGEKFGQVKYVIIILGIAKLYELINSLNYSIIIFTQFYKYEIFFQIVLLILTVTTNIILIPRYGIEGAALATGITLFINTTLRAVFVYLKYRLTPFRIVSLKVILIMAISFLATYYVPIVSNSFITMCVKSTIILIVYGLTSLMLHVSEDVKDLKDQFFNFIKRK